jgi:ribonuclease HI
MIEVDLLGSDLSMAGAIDNAIEAVKQKKNTHSSVKSDSKYVGVAFRIWE